MHIDLSNIYLKRKAESRSLSAEDPTGEKGKGAMVDPKVEGRFLPLQDDISSVAYWYQTLPHASLPSLPDRNAQEIV